jgi:hypothetical protein
MDLVEQMLGRLAAGRNEWPLGVVTEVHLVGSFADGVTGPLGLGVAVGIDREDERWLAQCITSLIDGADPYAPIRRALGGDRYRFWFDGHADVAVTLVWRRGDAISTALQRLQAIPADDRPSWAARDATLAQLDGLDRWIPRPRRQRLCDAVDHGAITLERIELPDAPVRNQSAVDHLDGRWASGSPLRRAGRAVLAHLEQRGVNLDRVHLHGRDITGPTASHYVGFALRYFRSIPCCLAEHRADEWIEVVHPSCVLPMYALRIVPADRELLAGADWS